MTLTLTAENLNAHARMLVPVHRVELDETRRDWFIQVRVLHRVRVHVAFKHLQTAEQTSMQKDNICNLRIH